MAISIHPRNPKLFQFRGRPLVLICATEHYGAVLNRPFRFERYLTDAAGRGQTLTRLFTLFRELQSAVNPYSTCKPESTDYIAPFARTGPGKALDGEPRYDLEIWNPEYFQRLHAFLSKASDLGVIVEVVLFSNTYADNVWALNPLNPANNISMDATEPIPWHHYLTCRRAELLKWQEAHVRRIVAETNRYDNILYEICNEPGGFRSAGDEDRPAVDEVNAWQSHFIRLIRSLEEKLPQRHLIAGQQAFTYDPFEQPADATFAALDFDVVNIHPLPNTCWGGQHYDMGTFMSKELKLRPLRDFALATYALPKPLNYDEDNVATRYRDLDGWTIHRKRAWTALFCGAHYDMIDFSIAPYLEAGTPESRRGIRRWMGHLSSFVHALDLARARPLTGFLQEQPPHTIASVLAVAGEDYCIYLADERELTAAGGGEMIAGNLAFDLPDGQYEVSCYSPVTGEFSPALTCVGGPGQKVAVPAFHHDIVVRVKRRAISNN